MMKALYFFITALMSTQLVWGGPVGVSPAQEEVIREQQEAFGGVPEREIQYERETAPRDPDADHDFLLKDHPLEEMPLEERQVQ